MRRHHMYEVQISHFMTALTGEKTSYWRRQKIWPSILDKVNIQEDIVILDWNNLQVGSALHTLNTEALDFGKRVLAWGTFARGDDRKLCERFVYYLCGPGSVPNFSFHHPGACHEARFMANSLYLLALQMTQKISNIMNIEEKKMVETASFFVSICYGPLFLKPFLGAA